jgi:hypothetical protein
VIGQLRPVWLELTAHARQKQLHENGAIDLSKRFMHHAVAPHLFRAEPDGGSSGMV